MKFSEAWLREWVNPSISTKELGHCLTMAGLELDSIEPAAPFFDKVVVARVDKLAPHPDADKLRVCQVDDGSGNVAQVVCGAPNVTEGMRVPFAQVGAQLPGDLKIRKAKLRGVESLGMLCSAKEVGLSEDSSGLMSLPEDAPLGQSLRDYLVLDDAVLDVDLTPNRADCLSIAGIARETSVLTASALSAPEIPTIQATTQRVFDVEVLEPSACPRYAGRVIEDIDPVAITPLWLQEKLRRSGLRSINPVVDVTNYVMLELGQPMHAFDLNQLDGGIQVRMAQQDEVLTLLDGQEVKLDSDTLLITDHERPLAMAGIMGGLNSGVTDASRTIFLESAFFAPQSIAGRARKHGLHTDSSHRFERGVDPELQLRAIERATALLLKITGGRPGPIIEQVSDEHLSSSATIVLRATQVKRVLGIDLGKAEVLRILEGLQCRVETTAQGWSVTPPSFRFDMQIEVDLIEELGRIYGYERIPTHAAPFSPVIQDMNERRITLNRLRALLVDHGYQEAITYSFIDPALEQAFNPDHSPRMLANPISTELSAMRSSLLPGLIKALQYNLNRQQSCVRLFEAGRRFDAAGENGPEKVMLAGVLTGEVTPKAWDQPARIADFFDIKGDVQALLGTAGIRKDIGFEVAVHPALHPGQSARVDYRGATIGWIGALHPRLQEMLGIEQNVYMFELDVDGLAEGLLPHFEILSRYPAIRRDIALVVDEGVTAAQITSSIHAEEVQELKEVHLFDVYIGKGVPDGRKSVALGLILQDLSRTLTDNEVEQIQSRLISRLTRDTGATLRE